MPADGALERALEQHFGLTSFRPLQREVIAGLLDDRPAMAILPTGGGKSLCYQLPALLLPGVTLVISPLISLMKDQVDALVARRIPAVAINSQDAPAEARDKLGDLAAGRVKLAFVAPERLRHGAFLAACRRARISLLAVDEAHCVSQWGHDFRPDYRSIRGFHQAIGAPPLLALTATARPEVQRDVMEQLGIAGAPVFRASADRPNLWLGLESCETEAEKRAKVASLAARSGGSTIVYASSRRDAEAWAALLREGLAESVAYYHAGLSHAARTEVQNGFMAGRCRVVVATNAFGMGIDKPDIRAVIHIGVPDSLEAYFQEIGRAGRDGLPAVCTMVLLPGKDVRLREYMLDRERIDVAAAEGVLRQVDALAAGGGGVLPPAGEGDALALLVVSHLQALAGVELVQRSARGLELRVEAPLAAAARAEVQRRLREQERSRHERFQRMRQFVYLGDRCRRAYVLRYFGEPAVACPERCCSACHPMPLTGGRLATPVPKPGRRDAVRRDTGRRDPVRLTRLDGAADAEADAEVAAAADALVARLKAWRRTKAAALNVPAYIVFADKVLVGIAARVPRSLDDLATCPGIGPAKLQQFGEELLAEIRAAAMDPL